MIDRHKDDHDCYFIDVSDCLDLIIPQGGAEKKRWNAAFIEKRYATSNRPVDDAIIDYAKLIGPIKDRLIAMLDGNHHQTILNRCGTDPTARICEELWGKESKESVLRRHSYAGYLRLHFDDIGRGRRDTHTIPIYMCHGIGGSTKTEGGSQTTIGNNAKYHRAAIHVYGHNHQLRTWDVTYTAPGRYGPKIKSAREIRVNTGTFQKQYLDGPFTSYGERQQFKPSEIGYPVLEFQPSRKGVEITYWKKVYL
jgi:hypothetical protein